MIIPKIASYLIAYLYSFNFFEQFYFNSKLIGSIPRYRLTAITLETYDIANSNRK